MVEANSSSVGLCPIGGMNFVPITSALAPKYGQVKVLHSLVIGLFIIIILTHLTFARLVVSKQYCLSQVKLLHYHPR